jgi:hypothetical protein
MMAMSPILIMIQLNIYPYMNKNNELIIETHHNIKKMK